MKYKIGDKVSFLNEKRDGVVSRIISSTIVGVTIEDGFEIPVAENEILKMMDFSQAIIAEEEIKEVVVENENIRPLSFGKELEEGVYLAYMLDKNAESFQGKLAVYLVNHTPFEAVFIYAISENGKFVWTDYDRVDEKSKYLLANIEMPDLEKWSELYFEIMFYKGGSSDRKKMIAAETKVKSLKFYKDESYRSFPSFEGKCLLIPVKNSAEPEPWADENWENIKIELSKGSYAIKEELKTIPFPEKLLIETGVGEIDLHIQNITESYHRLNNSEMLTMQLSYFIKYLERAIHSGLDKLIVIHGVGNGVLKGEIRNMLTHYEGLQSGDASIMKYGVGATEITFTKN